MKNSIESRSNTTAMAQSANKFKLDMIFSDSEIKFQNHRKRNGLIAEWEAFSDREFTGITAFL